MYKHDINANICNNRAHTFWDGTLVACTGLAWRSHKTTNISWLFENNSMKRGSIIRSKITSLLPSIDLLGWILLVPLTLVHFNLIKAFTNFLLDYPGRQYVVYSQSSWDGSSVRKNSSRNFSAKHCAWNYHPLILIEIFWKIIRY